MKDRKPWRICIGIACVAALAACGGLDAPATQDPARIGHRALGTADGVVFLSPVTTETSPASEFDTGVALSIEIFAFDTPTDGAPTGAPIGPSFSTADGSIVVQDGAYAAIWRTRDSDRPDGSRVRVEVRLGHARAGAPACDGGVNVRDAGCLAFFDAYLARRPNAALPAGTDPATVVLNNGRGVAIRFYIRQDAANVPPMLHVTASAAGEVLGSDERLQLDVVATDLEDGDLTSSVAWTSSVDGPLGTGGSLDTSLTPGMHQITASVVDSAGAMDTADYGAFVLAFTGVDPAGTYLVTSASDAANSATRILLEDYGAAAGDWLAMRVAGEYRPGSAFEETHEQVLAVFDGPGGFVPTEGGEPFASVFCEGIGSGYTEYDNDVAEDFLVEPSAYRFVRVPEGATEVRFSVPDCFYSDNTDTEPDFGVAVGVFAFARVDVRGTYLATAPQDSAEPPTTVSLGDPWVAPGAYLYLFRTGRFRAGSAIDQYPGMIAAFLDGGAPIAGGGGQDVATETCFDQDFSSNDIPQDFRLEDEGFTVVRIPDGADALALAALDCFYADNSDSDGDFGAYYPLEP